MPVGHPCMPDPSEVGWSLKWMLFNNWRFGDISELVATVTALARFPQHNVINYLSYPYRDNHSNSRSDSVVA